MFSNIGKNVMDLEKTVTENIEDTTPELSFRTISEVISDEDTGTSTSSLRAENKEIQDVNGTQTSYRSDISTSKLNESEKLSRIKELLIKASCKSKRICDIDKLIEEKESVQSHMNLLNEKFKLLKKRAKTDMKYIQMRIRSHTEKGEEYLVPPLKKKQMSLVKNLEQARVENKGEYEKLMKEKVKIKQTLQQQKALIMSYLKSLQFRGRNLQEDHRSRSSLSDDDRRSISSNSATHIDLPSAPPSVEDEERPSSHGSEPSDNSGIVPIGNQEGSSKEVVTLLDTSSKQEQISVDKFNNSEAVTEYTPPTEAETDISDLGRRVRGLHEQLRKKKQKAEKLSREYRMKKKQQLRNEEQILLKQLQCFVCSSHFVIMSTEQRTNIKFCVLLHKTPAETLRLLEEAYGEAVMKKTPVYAWHKRFSGGRDTYAAADQQLQQMKQSLSDLIHHAFIPEGRTVTKELYVEILLRLRNAVRRKRPEKWVENNWFLMHDNAPAHRAIIVKNFLPRHNITDLSPPDYFLFPHLKSHLKGQRFNAEEEYDAYINKTRKELEDCRDNLTGTSLLSDKLLQEDKIQLPLFRDTTKHPSKKKLLKQEEIRQEEDNSMSEQSTILQSSGTVESSHQISPKNITSKTSTLKDQLKESLDVSSSRAEDPELKAQNDISENLDIKTALRSFITSGDNARQQSIPVEEDLEEVSEELEEVIEQVEDISENLEVQTDIEDERQWTSNSTVHTQNDESTINELLDKSDSVIQEVLMEELESKSVIEESIGIKLRSEVTEEMHTENPESTVHELLDQSDSPIQEVLVEKLESGSVIEELDEEKSSLQYDMQELPKRKHDLASDIQDIIEEKYDSASASGKTDSESVIQEYLDKFESDTATHDTLYSTQEPSINNERPVSRSFVQELVVSKEKSTIEEQGESVDEVESIPEEEEEDESDIVTRIEEKDVRSSFEQNLRDGEQYSSSFIDQTEEKVAASGTMNLSEDAVHDSVHDVLKHEETENDKKDVDEKREEMHKHDIRNLEEFHIVKESESLSVASEISETSFEKESEENVSNRDIVKSKEKNDEELSKKVERITDMIFQNLLKESLEKFETKNSEVNNRREFSDQLIKSTEDSEVHDRSEFGDQLIESTKNSEIHDKSEVYDKNESGSHIIESTKDSEVHDRSEFGSQMIESTKDSVYDKSEFGSQLIESTKDSEVHDKSEFGEELIESKKDSEVYDETESGGHLIENTKDSEVQERSEFGSLLVESTKVSEVHDKSEFDDELIEIERNSEVYDKNEPGSQLIGSTKDSEVHDKSEFDDELLETRKDSEVYDKNDSGGQLIESGESSEVHEENEFREQVIKSTENKVVLSETQDKTVNRVDNITNSILEQLLIESSLLLCSKKTTYVSTSKENDLSGEGKNEEVAAVGEVVAIGSPILTSEQSDRNGVNVRKRVSEILAESSGSLSSAKEKTRPQDFMITTYDVLSPEETPSHTPQPGFQHLCKPRGSKAPADVQNKTPAPDSHE
ncbi:hypothetical protein ANN_21880 [Periplaneta americana]|uniref:Uncharacterized protein n=1 Tax=Periplaneta americana TaxID=6978 RepID=A0ABQ8S728_PERAM|nr:hypothetical protein ANN_21880 [Periplaneta americana]